MKDAWNWVIVIGVVLIIGLGTYGLTRHYPCVETLDVTKGQNFNQPILTEHNCKPGETPTNWRNF